MLRRLPAKSEPMENVFARLEEYTKDDIKVKGGRLFTYLYDSGLEELARINDIYVKFLNRNAMDYHAFPSTLRLENEVVAMIGSLLNGDEKVTGNFTTGGTESILIAVKAARDQFLEKRGSGAPTPEIVIPVTAHPAFRKAAEYLRMKPVLIPVSSQSYLVEPETIRNAISDKTAIVISSAPNFPYGGIDPIEKIAEIASENKVWLHVDACVGGLILPFLDKIGVPVKKWDFSVPGVSSISVDLHKYGYTPKGSSVILYRNKDLRKYQLYVNADWPGYPMSNIGVQSTKSSAPLAASWAVLNYLGEEGYLNLARRTVSAKEQIVKGITSLGYRIVGEAETTIFAFTSDSIDIFEVGAKLKEKGWFLQVQPGSSEMGMPPSLHLNSSPVHDKVAPDFIEDLSEITESLKSRHPRTLDQIMKEVGAGNGKIDGPKLIEVLTSEDSPLNKNKNLLYELIRYLPSEIVEKAFLEMVNSDFSSSVE